MKRYLLDTGIAGEYIGNRGAVFARVYAEQAKGNHVGICVPVLAELVFGVEYSSSRELNMRLLLKGLRTIRLWPFGKAEAFEYGRLNAH